jgi:hypothetical protein
MVYGSSGRGRRGVLRRESNQKPETLLGKKVLAQSVSITGKILFFAVVNHRL